MVRNYKILFTVTAVVAGLFSTIANAQPLAQGRDKFLGCGTSSTIYGNLHKYWNQVTPGNDGKWGSVQPSQGQYNWTNLDNIYNYTIEKGFLFKEHTFVWGSQQPSWVAALDSAGQRAAVENWIHLVGERYPQMALVDVVNEPFHAVPSYKNALGGDGVTGWDWVVTAFQWARQYCAPNVKLILNEFNVLHDNNITTNYLRLIDTLKVRGLIDGIGIQSHYFEFRSDMNSSSGTYVYNVATIKANLNRLTATGIPVYITEFDIDEPIDSNQLAQYKIYFPIFWRNPRVKGITLWGYHQNDVWNSHPNTFLITSEGRERPALAWLRTYVLSPAPPVLIFPVAEGDVPRNPLFTWHPSDSAASYRVQVSYVSSFLQLILDSTVADTALQIPLLDSNKNVYWRVSAANSHGSSENSPLAGFTTGSYVASSVDPSEKSPNGYLLSQNYPNPFNPSTNINYHLPMQSVVTLAVYDALGREIAVLVNKQQPAGSYSVTFDVHNGIFELPSGMYLYRLTAGNYSLTKKFVLLK